MACITTVVVIVAVNARGVQLAACLALGLLACGAVFARVRYPYALLAVAWVMTLAVTQMLLIPALFSLGVRRRNLISVGALVVTVALLGATYSRGERLVSVDGVDLDAAGSLLAWILNVIAVVAVPYLLGVSLNVRRELMRSYEERAVHAEQERAALDREAVLMERQRISSEVHDILGHKLALISMQAGALEVNADSGAANVERQAARIGQSARDGLVDLRTIIGTLDAQDLMPYGLEAISKLVEESRASGASVELDLGRIERASDVPEDVGRAGYRIVQESLTNAHRHAPGATVRVAVAGRPGDALHLEIRNQLPLGGLRDPTPPSGRGLPGLRERARSVGGQFHTTIDGADFLARAELPWPAPSRKEG